MNKGSSPTFTDFPPLLLLLLSTSPSLNLLQIVTLAHTRMNVAWGTKTTRNCNEHMLMASPVADGSWNRSVRSLRCYSTESHRYNHTPCAGSIPIAFAPVDLSCLQTGAIVGHANQNSSIPVACQRGLCTYGHDVQVLQHHHQLYNQRQRLRRGAPREAPVAKETGSVEYGAGPPTGSNSKRPLRWEGSQSSLNESRKQKKRNSGSVRDLLFVAHVSNFSQLEELRRTNSLPDFLQSFVPKQANPPTTSMPMRFLIVVEKLYLAACVSIPPSPEDVVLSERTAVEFLEVRYVHCDDGHLLVDLKSGTCVAKRIHSTFRKALVQLSKLEAKLLTGEYAGTMQVLQDKSLFKGISYNPLVYAALFNLLTQNGGEGEGIDAADLWSKLIREPTPNSSHSDTAERSHTRYEKAEDGEKHLVGDTASLLPSCGVALFSTVYGVRLFKRVMGIPGLRRLFFQLLVEAAQPMSVTEVTTPPPLKDDEALERSTANVTKPPSEQCFMAIFSCSLTSYFLFECFGLVDGADCCEEEVDIICACLKRSAVKVACSNGGSFTMIGLIKALSTRRFGECQRNWQGDEGSVIVHEKSASIIDPNSESNVLSTSSPHERLRVRRVQSDEKFFRAVIRGFVAGEGPGSTREEKVSRGRRVKFLTQHVIACRVTQSLIPVLVDSIHLMEDRMKKWQRQEPVRRGEEEEEDLLEVQYFEDCTAFLEEATDQCGLMVNHAHGNYVLQALIRELVKRSTPRSFVEKMLQKVSDMLIASILEVSKEKFASNCLEAMIDACKTARGGNGMILCLGSTLLRKGRNRMLQVTFDQYGNYVVRKMLNHITALAVGEQKAMESEREEARRLRGQYFSILAKNSEQLRTARYGSGIYDWICCQSSGIPASHK
ncbi:hypothetical protein, conserved [Trypanosoma brucei gambiense DAL972]|uniref:Uncharacterized protein n=1 Tax=Trypanosoma brucei gambiense (strain MHOM/CI/86/DAL972) TaxID=679716 RepID=D0A8U2_TRYB9|nr:hypothetical protein, conserved [Trypanosoma brucei gambiense DAL972]CBH18093.1 hypothetical protein, conserved [Trypanosoma brucei gambiense DAL972]|eukprot:XP_011780357.1 hypothetical protein, conserved [Trypanosoma brucei gambiense DAL972]